MPTPRPTRLPRDNHRPGSPTLLRFHFADNSDVGRFPATLLARRLQRATHPLSNNGLVLAVFRRYWNMNQLSIDYASRPRLRSRLTLGGLAFPRKPWAYGGGVSNPSLATHTNILTRPRSTSVHTAASLRDRRSATTPQNP